MLLKNYRNPQIYEMFLSSRNARAFGVRGGTLVGQVLFVGDAGGARGWWRYPMEVFVDEQGLALAKLVGGGGGWWPGLGQ